MQYVRWASRQAIHRGYSVSLVTLEECLDHPLYHVMQRECGNLVQPVILSRGARLGSERLLEAPSLSNLVKREFLYHSVYSRHFKSLPEAERPDSVLVPYIDYFAYATGLIGSPFAGIPWSGIVLRPSFHTSSVGVKAPATRLRALKKNLFFRLLKDRSLRRMFTIDETLAAYVEQRKSRYSKKLKFVPDPVRLSGTGTRREARRDLGFDDDTVVLLVYGALTLRKGIDALLNAIQRVDFPQEICLLLAGKQDDDVRCLLASEDVRVLREAGRLREIDAFLDDEDEYRVFRAADIVWMGYRGHYGSSGVLTQAGTMRLPVVACDVGLIDWMTREYELGLTVAVDDARSVAAALGTLTSNRALYQNLGENGRKLAARHNGEFFAKEICDAVSLV